MEQFWNIICTHPHNLDHLKDPLFFVLYFFKACGTLESLLFEHFVKHEKLIYVFYDQKPRGFGTFKLKTRWCFYLAIQTFI